MSIDSILKLRRANPNISMLKTAEAEKSFYRDILEFATGDDGVIDGSKLQQMNFPSLEDHYDVFISYSHDNNEQALYLASWLKNCCGLSCFLDSIVWKSADNLLQEIDNQYCWQPQSKTYNYRKRNFSTSHVHVMLSMAILEVINRSECCIIIDSDKTFPLRNRIDNHTLSPWIYEEISIINHILPVVPERLAKHGLRLFSGGGRIYDGRENNSRLNIKYSVNLDSFNILEYEDVKSLYQQGLRALDDLYFKKSIVRSNFMV